MKRGPAIRAIDEGVPVAAVAGIEQLAHAVIADCDVRRDEGADGGRALAPDDAEGPLPPRLDRRRLDGVDAGERRRITGEAQLEGFERGRVALDLDEHALGVVADVAAEAQSGGQPMDERPEADTLHDAAHPESTAHHGGCGEPGRSRAGMPLRSARPSVTAASRWSRPKL